MTATDGESIANIPGGVHRFVAEYLVTIYDKVENFVNCERSLSEAPHHKISRIERYLEAYFQTMDAEECQKIRDFYMDQDPVMDTNAERRQESEHIFIHEDELKVWSQLSDLMAYCDKCRQTPAVQLLLLAKAITDDDKIDLESHEDGIKIDRHAKEHGNGGIKRDNILNMYLQCLLNERLKRFKALLKDGQHLIEG